MSQYFRFNGPRENPHTVRNTNPTLMNAKADQTGLNLYEPPTLHNLDQNHKLSLARRVETNPSGRFSTAPRTFFFDGAVARSNNSRASRTFIDPYNVADGNLLASNWQKKKYQKGGQTALTGRNETLTFQREILKKSAMEAKPRFISDKFVTGREWSNKVNECKRDRGPDPYAINAGNMWHIPASGFHPNQPANAQPKFNTFPLARGHSDSGCWNQTRDVSMHY